METTSTAGKLAREPLVHFALLGLVLFTVAWLRGAREEARIHVPRSTIETLVRERQYVLGRDLTGAERAAVLRAIVDEEILVREALDRGLEHDGRVRARLAEKMRQILRDPTFEEPGEAELREYFEANRDRYETGTRLVLEHVSFPSREEIPGGLLEALRSERVELRGLGDSFLLSPADTATYHVSRLERTHGGRFVAGALALPRGEWGGPVDSAVGTHFLRVHEVVESVPQSFEEVRHYLRNDWELWKVQQSVEDRLTELRKRYEVVVEE